MIYTLTLTDDQGIVLDTWKLDTEPEYDKRDEDAFPMPLRGFAPDSIIDDINSGVGRHSGNIDDPNL